MDSPFQENIAITASRRIRISNLAAMPRHLTYMARLLAGTGATLLSFACRPPEPAPAGTIDATGADLPAAVHAHMDSAAAAYSDGDFPGARTHYSTATDSAPDLAAGWFGLVLAERALGNIPAADSALGRARSIAASDSVTARPGS
jgi:hypothetical protein